MPAERTARAPEGARARSLVFWFATAALVTATALLAPPLEADPDLWGWDVVCHEETALGPPACR
ncbi:MAG: hypothetical protein QN174_06115 [Armatimonadota bacterium]|nr:hypothetical protein [Armatimonadota bacterium]MDR7421560.1 hypothetical protein [Armatimonadota bacterium]MDR7455634.1 hypothetical protein [Armatimonadota bacterium]MDR7458091.1 hypothetical protein [Armatimonadota bacterium]MDR7496515.1 hypothetical protein [Armatimonadota bacterium]